ncbi:MAG: hypothetical protein ACYTAF_14865 [Planctomycetota bacterium]
MQQFLFVKGPLIAALACGMIFFSLPASDSAPSQDPSRPIFGLESAGAVDTDPPLRAPAPSSVPPAARPAGALIAFENPALMRLDPDNLEPLILRWHAIAKVDADIRLVTVAKFFSDANGNVTRPMPQTEADPSLPYTLPGAAAGGIVDLGGADRVVMSINRVSNLPGSRGVDRLVIVLTLVCIKGNEVVAQDAAVCRLVSTR